MAVPNPGAPANPGSTTQQFAWFAIATLIAFAVVTLVLAFFTAKTTEEVQWSRLIFLYGGFEAIAFAAAGYLFGREVNRQRAEAAEERAVQAEAQTKLSNEAAITGQLLANEATTKGMLLAEDVKAAAREHMSKSVRTDAYQAYAEGADNQTEAAQRALAAMESDWQALGEKAARLFP